MLLNDLIGKEFEFGGRGPDRFDCYGLAMEIYERLGKKLPEVEELQDNYEDIGEMVTEKRPEFQRLNRLEPFCLVSFIGVPPYVNHIGIVLEDCKRFIHILRKSHVVIERLDHDYWKRRIEGYYKWTIFK